MSTQSKKTHSLILIIILTMMSMVGLVGSDVYLPAMPLMGEVFHQDIEAMQYTLSLYLVGLAIGQLILGPLSDRYGRKKPVIIGMMIYCMASLFCATSDSYAQIMVFRFLQALGAASGLVIGRAIITDVYEKNEAGKVFATIFPFVGMSPAISPVMGGFLSYYWGWSSSFYFIALFALTIIVMAMIWLPETLPQEKRSILSFKNILISYPSLLLDKNFMTYALAPCIAYVAYFAYIAQSPFIFNAHGYGEREIGLLYITLSCTYVSGNIFARKALNKITLNRLLYIGYSIFLIGGLSFFMVALSEAHIAFVILAMSILTFGNGILIPMGFAGSLNASLNRSGSASGLLGFLQLNAAALSSSFVGSITQNSVTILGLGLCILTMVGFSSFWMLMRRNVS